MVRGFPLFINQVFGLRSSVEQRSIFEHGAGDVEETVTNCEESASMDAAAGFFLRFGGTGGREGNSGNSGNFLAGSPRKNRNFPQTRHRRHRSTL
jgi:hypothetical protein